VIRSLEPGKFLDWRTEADVRCVEGERKPNERGAMAENGRIFKADHETP
jgi:hypothetical protein